MTATKRLLTALALALPPSTALCDSAEEIPAIHATPASATESTANPDQSTSPQSVIATLNDALLAVLQQSNELAYDERFALLVPTLRTAFDLEYMARQVVGRGFRALDDEERAQWYELFTEYMTSNYASRFDHYSQQTFAILGEEEGARDTILIRTRITDPPEDDVDLSYRLRETQQGWKVIDVYLKGTVSELALRRAEYASVLKNDGFAALTSKVRNVIDESAASAQQPHTQ